MKVKDESEEVGLNLIIQKTKIMASSPITSWQINGDTMQTVTYFILLGSKINADGDFLPWKKICDQPRQHIKKQRHYFGDKNLSSLSYGFYSSQVWM